MFATDIGALEEAETKAATRAKGAATFRDAKLAKVKDDLREEPGRPGARLIVELASVPSAARSWYTPAMRRSSIGLCVLALGIAACSGGYDPSGSYQGKAASLIDNFKPSTERPPSGEFFEPVAVKSLGGDLYEVSFGACAVNVKRPPKSGEHLWKLAAPKTCATKLGDVLIAQGHLQVWTDQDKVNFGFEGTTSDDRYKVTFTFAPSARAAPK